jgi:hypothetical protein
MMSEKLEQQIASLTEKVDRILELLGARGTNRGRMSAQPQKAKAVPLSAEEIATRQSQFEQLFATWDSGEELQVEKLLDAMDADEIRRFADANNLNVTSKTSKQKVMQLIAGRFRERRQLMRSHFGRGQQA